MAAAIAEGYTDAGGRDWQHVPNHEQALTFIDQRFAVGTTAILVKASRSAGLDLVVGDLTKRYPQPVAERRPSSSPLRAMSC